MQRDEKMQVYKKGCIFLLKSIVFILHRDYENKAQK